MNNRILKGVFSVLLTLAVLCSNAAVFAPVKAVEVTGGKVILKTITDGYEMDGSSSIDDAVFNYQGTYTFKIESIGTNTAVIKEFKYNGTLINGGDYTADLTNNDTVLVVYGLRITKNLDSNGNPVKFSNDSINANPSGDAGRIITIKAAVPDSHSGAYITSAKVVRSGTSSSNNIKKGVDVDLIFYIVDPAYPALTSKEEVSPTVGALNSLIESGGAYLHSNSFNGQKTGNKGSIKITALDSSESVGGKLTFKVEFVCVEYTGIGNTADFTFDYSTKDGANHTYTLTRSFPEVITYSQPTNDDDDDDKVKLDPLVPNIIISNYDYGAYSVEAGENFTLNMNFSNTSTAYDLENIVMKIAITDGFSITNASNSYYLTDLKAGQTQSHTITLQALASAKAQAYPISIDFSYQYVANDLRKSATSAESISIPITQSDRFSIDEIQVPTMIWEGEDVSISLGMINKGKGEIYNVTAELRGEGITNSGERQFVGNVASGTETSADFYVNTAQSGEISGQVVITYEDSNAKTKEVVRPFTLSIMANEPYDPGYDPGGYDPGVGPVEPEKPSLFTVKNIGLGIAFLLIAVMSFYSTFAKIKAQRSEDLDEDI